TTVRAEAYGDPMIWGVRSDWQNSKEFGVKPIEENADHIKLKTIPDAELSVRYKKNKNEHYQLIKKNIRGKLTKQGDTWNSENLGDQPQIAVADGNGMITFPLEQNYRPKNGYQYELTLTIGGFYLAGCEWIVGESETQDKKEAKKQQEQLQKEKIKEILETQKTQEVEHGQQQAEDMYQKYIDYDNSKLWYKRFKDNVKGYWYNFKGWLYGTAY
ncbi:TPA: hypothetical protein TUY00_000672, partial [Streptococcus equi subsp. zooepidemicus]|nr:hypothetical protein [Streptococcus equi subsp. zooepidemicus]